MSGGKRRSVAALLTLSSMANGMGRSTASPAERAVAVTASTLARGGASLRRRRTKASRPRRSPAASISTRPAAFRTRPARPSSVARRQTNGRKPTPWTTPSTTMLRAPRLVAAAGTGAPGSTGADMRIGCRYPSLDGWAERPVDGIRGAFVTLDSGRAPAFGARSTQERGPPGPLPQHPEATR